MYLARWGGVGCCVLDRRVRARSEDPTHGNGEPRAKKKWRPTFSRAFFFSALCCLLVAAPPEDSADEGLA